MSKQADIVTLFEEFSGKIPDNNELGIEGAKLVAAKLGATVEDIRKNFSGFVSDTEKTIYDIYRLHEEEAGDAVLAKFLAAKSGKPIYRVLDAFFLSIAQSRKARAGKALEAILGGLFKQCNYPFDQNRVINGKPDFIMPSEEHFRAHAADCIIFTAKRKLRERWRQIVTEGTQGAAFFLATLDDEVTTEQIGEMRKKKIYMVVPATLKVSTVYKHEPNVISFEDFLADHLDPAIARWKKHNII
jgi:hypothetical protein